MRLGWGHLLYVQRFACQNNLRLSDHYGTVAGNISKGTFVFVLSFVVHAGKVCPSKVLQLGHVMHLPSSPTSNIAFQFGINGWCSSDNASY